MVEYNIKIMFSNTQKETLDKIKTENETLGTVFVQINVMQDTRGCKLR